MNSFVLCRVAAFPTLGLASKYTQHKDEEATVKSSTIAPPQLITISNLIERNNERCIYSSIFFMKSGIITDTQPRLQNEYGTVVVLATETRKQL